MKKIDTVAKNVVNDAEYYRQKIGIKTKNPEELEILFEKLDQTLEKMVETSGLTVDELIDALDPSKPFPF